ncbi:hypothetical protein Mapa_016281 [Marchantia paleacea]|nr:hypothetical protein Mapa_016281 [Marchantia paleacea]
MPYMGNSKLADKLNWEYLEELQVSIWKAIRRMPNLGTRYPITESDSVSCCVRQPPLTRRRSSRNISTPAANHHQKHNICFCPLESRDFPRTSSESTTTKWANSRTYFTALPDHVLVGVMAAVSSTCSSPADLIHPMLACKKLWSVGRSARVLLNAGSPALTVTAAKWSQGAHCFLKRCADAGNTEACYILGMIYFYSLGMRKWGAALMAKAAMQAHAAALQSLAIIQFNGSGGRRRNKDLSSAITLCAAGASLGYVDAMWELGHCLLTGYGALTNVSLGSSIIWKANEIEKAASASSSVDKVSVHTVNRFLVDWFHSFPPRSGLLLCSHSSCGRPETRKYEFKRCSACDSVQYCSKACQNWDWKFRHKDECLTKVMKDLRQMRIHRA